jgi:hypothetical protein
MLEQAADGVMMGALDALMAGIIDYAGLFPPAELPMRPVVENFATYRSGPHREMLGRLIVPAARMAEFGECASGLRAGGLAVDAPWSISALGRGGDEPAGLLANASADLADMRTLRDRHGQRVAIDAYEIRLPRVAFERSDTGMVADLTAQVTARLGEGAAGPLTPYWEVPLVGDWRRHLPRAIGGIAECNRSRAGASGSCKPWGVKLRTGGVEASAFPSVEQVATVLRLCRTEQLAFKATAGLHHPVRHYSEAVGTKMHGFLNVFGAAVLMYVHDLDGATAACMIEDEDADHFRISERKLEWRHFAASAAECAAARRVFAHGFGSCSFDEPIEGLHELGLM